MAKRCDPNAIPSIEKETVATALVNGNNGLGSVVGKYCMDLAIAKAKQVGIGMVSAYGSNHYGIAGMYTLQAIEHGCIGISGTNTSLVTVPTRSKTASLGTSPLAFGASAKNGDSFVLDMATSTVALGKVEIYERMNKPIPTTWALNENGDPEVDPKIAMESSRLQPLGGSEESGGYKGTALAMMIEILTGILSGSNYGPLIPRWGKDQATANLGHVFIAINPEAFAADFESRLGDYLGFIRSSEPKDLTRPVLVPGDPERIHMDMVDRQGGICYVDDQHLSNDKLAQLLNVKAMKSYVISGNQQ